jgi:hypothetical protein
MVAGPDNYNAFIAGDANFLYPVFSRGPIYIHIILEGAHI